MQDIITARPSRHDPVPDGQVGPFRRVPHAKRTGGFGYAFDPRCAACVEDRGLESFAWQIAGFGFALWTRPSLPGYDSGRADAAAVVEALFLIHTDRPSARYIAYGLPVGEVEVVGITTDGLFDRLISVGDHYKG